MHTCLPCLQIKNTIAFHKLNAIYLPSCTLARIFTNSANPVIPSGLMYPYHIFGQVCSLKSGTYQIQIKKNRASHIFLLKKVGGLGGGGGGGRRGGRMGLFIFLAALLLKGGHSALTKDKLNVD